ncbi:hypothetical protein [Microcoleus sp. CAWBG58]|uniref:hypothetical protein n=1 Tax=Microcoleus sp. CAWBG58 TaxID=2841651 RepID=UPI0025F4C9A4|nr:hypothetical protein [Microcoleus sp. CAWBG58]
MNSLILIDTEKAWGFQPILYGKLSMFIIDSGEPAITGLSIMLQDIPSTQPTL